MPTAFLELASVLVLATIIGIILRSFKQPLILAYIFSGIIISLFGFFKNIDKSVFDLLSNLGIAFLLFLVGVELKTQDLKYVGKTAIFTGLGQIFFTLVVGFILLSGLGQSPIEAAYIAFAITFSSTVIIIKLLSEKHDFQSLYGKIAIGYLLTQDFVAISALMILSGFGQGGHLPSMFSILLIFVKGLLLVGLTYLASKFILPILFKLTSTSTELLFVAAIAWAFLLSAVGAIAGFSIAIGAFLAGVAIASSAYRLQISARVKPLRDFFIVIFFILLGASISVSASRVMIVDILVLSLFILFGKPLIMLAIMKTLGFRNRTAFLSSVTGAQISEFSLILLTTGVALGHISGDTLSLVAGVGIVTIALSSYLILYGERIYRFLEKPFLVVLPQVAREPYVLNREKLTDHLVLVGGEQMGWDILEFLKTKTRDKNQIVVVDFNPDIIKQITASGYNAVFGDISEPEVLEELEFGRAKLIVVTDPDVSDNIHLIRFAKGKNYKGPIIATAYLLHDAILLYESGADYVVVPETVGGKHLAKLLGDHWDNLAAIKKAKSQYFEELLSHKIF